MSQSIMEKVVYAHIRRAVFERLGTLKNEFIPKTLSREEMKEAARQVLTMTEEAAAEFFSEMLDRVEKDKF